MNENSHAEADFPTEDVILTHLLVVSDLDRAQRSFYSDVLGAKVYREYGGSSCVLTFLGHLAVAGDERWRPTNDKPTVSFAPPPDPDQVSHEMTMRVPDCRAAYDTLRARGAVFLTPPTEWGY